MRKECSSALAELQIQRPLPINIEQMIDGFNSNGRQKKILLK